MDKCCGLCDFYTVNGFRDASGGVHDCCRFQQSNCHLKGCYFHCNPKKITHRTVACENYYHKSLDWEKVLA